MPTLPGHGPVRITPYHRGMGALLHLLRLVGGYTRLTDERHGRNE